MEKVGNQGVDIRRDGERKTESNIVGWNTASHEASGPGERAVVCRGWRGRESTLRRVTLLSVSHPPSLFARNQRGTV